jgi:hypothetical protein
MSSRAVLSSDRRTNARHSRVPYQPVSETPSLQLLGSRDKTSVKVVSKALSLVSRLFQNLTRQSVDMLGDRGSVKTYTLEIG